MLFRSQSGLRSYIACRILAGHGFEPYNFAGGYRYYEAVTSDRELIEAAAAGAGAAAGAALDEASTPCGAKA